MTTTPNVTSERTDALRASLIAIASEYQHAAFASSFGAEDMVLLDIIATNQITIDIFTLDTGRLPAETLDLVERVRTHYNVKIEVVQPSAAAVNQYVTQYGANAFYERVELRKACCNIRKVEPLRRALEGKKAWLTGLRREQAASRANLSYQEFDHANGLEKFNPLLDWSEADVWAYIRAHDVPYNALHDRGYPSIGCEPCTRAIKVGEDIRAGRWWWENSLGNASQQECGLHVMPTAVSPIVFSTPKQPTS
jgi:phosphoadenosine phosphosulfate reductase